MPFQCNYNDGYGPQDGNPSDVNIQPVVPFSLNEDWNVIVRTNWPLVWANAVVPDTGSQLRLGNATQSLFLSPSSPARAAQWSVGPVFLWPTATECELEPDKWGAGRPSSH